MIAETGLFAAPDMCRAGACDQARGIELCPAAGLEPGWGVAGKFNYMYAVPYAVFELAYLVSRRHAELQVQESLVEWETRR